MKERIMGIFVCMLFIATATTVFAYPKTGEEKTTQQIVTRMDQSLVNETWMKTYAVHPFNSNEGYSIDTTSDGGFIVTGDFMTGQLLYPDVCLMKTDASGNMIWMKTFGGIRWDDGNYVRQTTDGGYIIAANKNIFSSLPSNPGQAWLIKTDANGNMEWNKTYSYNNMGESYYIQETSDGGYITAVYSSSDCHFIKIDHAGTTVFDKTINENGSKIKKMVETPDHDFIGVGYDYRNSGNSEVGVCSINGSGDLIWEKTYGGSGADYGYSIVQAPDGKYVIAGYTSSFGPGRINVWILKIDSAGTVLSNITIGSFLNNNMAYSVKTTNDGGFIVAGVRSITWFPIVMRPIGLLIKLDSTLGTVWTQTFGGSGFYMNALFNDVTQTSDNAYVVTGRTSGPFNWMSQLLLMKTYGKD